ncbi:MAG: NADPH nitroreductase [Alphaproteobacteria bacterium]|jgi:3-hydroxyisobutyrate dehydrogenase|nr:NADPH nitroreductase [Alphaproteobacteria bacterium]PPR13136.1 MAG: 2-(hydroxymethyl)glutarate dehydrogenase [Alphaproteobacteria bacterium MarineAlpha12_Bin1]|tara:strand:+ start:2490 stop:3359 length:870 start_codon:yes stop_codon:yes gene_type:complete
MTDYGFIGLGSMGSAMSSHLVNAGLTLYCYDSAGTAKLAPKGAIVKSSIEEVAKLSEVIFLSLPDGKVVLQVAQEIQDTKESKTKIVVDLSTTGPEFAMLISSLLSKSNIVFIDAPVSGGRSGAENASLALMCSGPDKEIKDLRNLFSLIASNVIQVGKDPGQAQAMKLLNNFLSATSMAATSEAVLFGRSHNLDLDTMLSVLNVSSGRNTATEDKFPNRILTETYDAGFAASLMSKDVSLFREQVDKAETPSRIIEVISALWKETNEFAPGGDFTEIYRYLKKTSKSQ